MTDEKDNSFTSPGINEFGQSLGDGQGYVFIKQPWDAHNASTWNERERAAYDVGYRNGCGSMETDWIYALTEAFDLDVPEGEEINITSVVKALKAEFETKKAASTPKDTGG